MANVVGRYKVAESWAQTEDNTLGLNEGDIICVINNTDDPEWW